MSHFSVKIKQRKFLIALFVTLLFIIFIFPVKAEYGRLTRCFYGEVLRKDIQIKIVPWWLRGRYKVNEDKALCAQHRQAEIIYFTYKEAKEKGEEDKAREALETLSQFVKKGWKPKPHPKAKVLPISPSGEKPLSSVPGRASSGGRESSTKKATPSATEPGETPSPSLPESFPGGGSSSGGSLQEGPYGGNLLDLLPSQMEGYEIFAENEFPLQAYRLFWPIEKGEIILIGLYVERTDDATYLLKIKEAKEDYSVDWQEVRVGGRGGYWGHNGYQSALLLWRKGDLVFYVEIGAKSNIASYRDKQIEIGEEI